MKTISLLRHAKSDWDAPYGGDHERPLNERGKTAANLMGSHLKGLALQPDKILCSTALRTKETISILAKKAHWNTPVVFESKLYLCSIADIRQQIAQLSEEFRSVLIVGHQPTTGAFAQWLAPGADMEVPTCTFLSFNADIERWSEIKPNCAERTVYLKPKSL